MRSAFRQIERQNGRAWARSGVGARLCGSFLALLLVAFAGSAHAQETGTLRGQVVNAVTAEPLAGAQVFLTGDAGLGVLTNPAGQFLLVNVPTGPQTVKVSMIGYGSAEQQVNVQPGETVTADFTLRQTAIALDEIVVTGAGVQTEKRKLGNTIATINADQLADAPVDNLSEMLTGREPGVTGLPGGGLAGEGAQIRIRGSASLSESNEPIVYVDGVRVDNAGGFAGIGQGAGNPSRLNDINPESIERIEILKGAAAATLYGTEASNGVIQIFTKRGAVGAPRWTAKIEQGFSSYPGDRIAPNAGFARTPEQAANLSNFYSRDIQPFQVFEVPFADRIFETGNTQSYSLSLNGGADALTYYLSGRYEREDGPLGGEDLGPVRDANSKVQATFSATMTPTAKLQLQTSGSYVSSEAEFPNAGNSIYSPLSLSLYSKPERATCFSEMLGNGRCAGAGNPTGAPTFGSVRESLYRQVNDDTERFFGSLKAGYDLLPNVYVEGTVGIDLVDQRSSAVTPFGYNVDRISTSDTLGARSIGARRNRQVSADMRASWNTNFSPALSSTLVVGGQGFFTTTEESGGNGNVFPGPGINVAEAAQNRDLDESFLQVVNAGVFAQEQIGIQDYIFLTAGARYDKNSAFGESSAGALYPKVSVSVVPSSRPDWSSELLSTLRLRGAIGQAGLQPGAFDQFTTFSAIATTQGAGLRPDNLGNPDLKPELSTEWEIGAEAGLLQDRASLTATYWNRTVEDALVARQFAPSGGFISSQLDNIGELTAHGVELGLNAQVYNSAKVNLSMFANAAYISEEVTDLGGAPPIKAQGTYPRVRNFIMEGFAPGAMFGAKLLAVDAGRVPFDTNRDGVPDTRAELEAYLATPPERSVDDPRLNPLLADDDGDGDLLDHYLGKPTPDWSGSFGAELGFLRNFSLSTMFEYRLGFETHEPHIRVPPGKRRHRSEPATGRGGGVHHPEPRQYRGGACGCRDDLGNRAEVALAVLGPEQHPARRLRTLA